jgi:hypothetical protein
MKRLVLAEGWDEVSRTISPKVPADARHCMRATYYAGAMIMFKAMLKKGGDHDVEKSFQVLCDLKDELDRFQKEAERMSKEMGDDRSERP